MRVNKLQPTNILAIDTASEQCSVALLCNGQLNQAAIQQAGGHSQAVLGLVESLLVEVGITLDELDMLACDIGPGSFTGLRVGLGVAQGLAYGSSLPVVAVDSLTALAWAGAATHPEHQRVFLPMIDARMGEIYWALYVRDDKGGVQAQITPTLSSPETLLKTLGQFDELSTNRAPSMTKRLDAWHWLPCLPRAVGWVINTGLA